MESGSCSTSMAKPLAAPMDFAKEQGSSDQPLPDFEAPMDHAKELGSSDLPSLDLATPIDHAKELGSADLALPVTLVTNSVSTGLEGEGNSISPLVVKKPEMGRLEVCFDNSNQLVGEVARAWGSAQEWFLELKDGKRLRLPVEVTLPPTISEMGTKEGEDQSLWSKSCGEGSLWEDQVDAGAQDEIDTEQDLEGLGNTLVALEEDLEPISISPLAVVPPAEIHTMELIAGAQEGTPNLSYWVNMKRKAFGKYIGTSYEGHEEAVTNLLVAIEASRKTKAHVPDESKVRKQGKKGSRELKALASSVNYDSRSGKSDGGNWDGAIEVIQ